MSIRAGYFPAALQRAVKPSKGRAAQSFVPGIGYVVGIVGPAKNKKTGFVIKPTEIVENTLDFRTGKTAPKNVSGWRREKVTIEGTEDRDPNIDGVTVWRGDSELGDFTGFRKNDKTKYRENYVDDSFGDDFDEDEFQIDLEHVPYRVHGVMRPGAPLSSMITRLRYSPKTLVLEATFASDGKVCDYFQVPPSVWAELKGAYARGLSVGKLFWRRVRIMGIQHGERHNSRFPFMDNRKEDMGPLMTVAEYRKQNAGENFEKLGKAIKREEDEDAMKRLEAIKKQKDDIALKREAEAFKAAVRRLGPSMIDDFMQVPAEERKQWLKDRKLWPS
ncbi:MAG: hypothetical protein Pg6A_20040 [Termitinemataceae bacterium]|nr:MAG: hypothetical protein Pg6A_20040 [Termitinemataceae bacterium]